MMYKNNVDYLIHISVCCGVALGGFINALFMSAPFIVYLFYIPFALLGFYWFIKVIYRIRKDVLYRVDTLDLLLKIIGENKNAKL